MPGIPAASDAVHAQANPAAAQPSYRPPDERLPACDDILSEGDLREEIQDAMAALTEGEARVLRMYYGLDGQENMTLEEIGTYVGRTRERVRQIKEKALQKLRHPNRSEVLKEYYGQC